MPKHCREFIGLLGDYSFRVQFASSTDNFYIRVPLLTFASTNFDDDDGTCSIYVQYQSPVSQDPYTVVLGSLFF